MVFVYGVVTRKNGKEQRIANIYEPGRKEWPNIPISCSVFKEDLDPGQDDFVDCVEPMEAIDNWRKRGDVRLTEGWPKFRA